jgi:DNA polymerase-1
MKVGKARGVPVLDPKRGYYVMPSLQPVAALQGDPSIIHHLVRDFAKIPTVLSWPQDGSIKDVPYDIVSTKEEAQQVLDGLPKDSIVTIDIETDSKVVNIIDVYSDRLLCLAITRSDPNGNEHTTVFPREVLDGLLWPTDVQWCGQNFPFDRNGLLKYLNVDIPIVHDTMLMSYALDERGGRDEQHDTYGGIHGLGPQADEYCGAEFYKDKMKPGHKAPAELPQDQLYRYNAHDAGYTYRLANRYIPQLHSDGVYPLYHDRLMPLDRAMAEINYQGVNIDRKRLQDLVLDWGPRFLEGEERLIDLAQEYGFPGRINLNSHPQLSRFLYDILGLEGGPSTAKDVIIDLEHPFIDALLLHKKLDHIWKHYIIPGVRSIKFDGRVHPNTLIHGTTSGRFAYVDPPLQTLPQKYSVGEYAEIRSIYVPDSSEYYIAEFDYAQIEVWIAAGLSQDQHMLEALASGDYHSATARDIMGVAIDDMDRDSRYVVRQNAKKVGFGVIYDIGAVTLSKPRTGINSTVREAQQIIDSFYEVNHQYKQWTEDIVTEARTKGQLITPFGRHRRFRLFIDQKQKRQAINFPVQSIANDYTLSALLELHFGMTLAEIAAGHVRPRITHLQSLGARIMWGVHDSIVLQIRKDRAQETIDYVKGVMEQQWLPDMPHGTVEAKVGDNLYDVKEWAA